MVYAIFRVGSHGWTYVAHYNDMAKAKRMFERYKKDMPHEEFRLDSLVMLNA